MSQPVKAHPSIANRCDWLHWGPNLVEWAPFESDHAILCYHTYTDLNGTMMENMMET